MYALHHLNQAILSLLLQGGIKTEKLSIAKEPEAASIFCRHLPVEKSSGDTISSLPPESKYMVLDAGGICMRKTPKS